MPTAINFTIKDGASTPADTLFTNLQPAGGSLPAVYQAKTKGVNAASQPKIQVSSETTNQGRRVRMTIRTPYSVLGTDGVTKVVGSAFTEITTTLPDLIPDSVRGDHWAYVANSCDVPQLADAGKQGYAPN